MLLSNPFLVDPRVSKEAKSLVDNGHEVTVIVWDRKGAYPPEDKIDGVRIIRIHNSFLMKCMPNDLFRNPLWWRKAYKKGRELYKTSQFRFDAVHCHDLDTLQAGVWLKKKLGIKLIYDAHEIFGYMIARDMPKLIVDVAFLMEKRLIKNAAHVITVDDGYAKYFRMITDKPLVIVRNCKDIIGNYQPPSRKDFSIVYIGSLVRSRFFPQILYVVAGIREVKLVIAAKKEALYYEVEKLAKKIMNIEFLGTISVDKVIPLTRECHVVICIFNPNNQLHRIGSPNKLFDAMVTGRPIIVTKGTHAGEVVEKEKCGLTIEFTEKSLEAAIKKLRDNPKLCEELGKNGLKAAMENYNWETEEKKLIAIYNKSGIMFE
jgi:glycosyltransferase involved in cell wall biosynthesis